MPDKISLTVNPRKVVGRKVKQLRRDGLIPANISGKGVKSTAVQVPAKEFKVVFTKAGETGIVELKLGSETKIRPALIHLVQIHPVSDEVLHIDFRQVDLTEKITVAIPLEIVGTAPAVAQGGVLIQILNQIEVEALPKDLPEKFEIDVSGLVTVGQGISLKDIKVDAAKIKLLTENLEELVVKIEEPTKEEVAPAPVEEVAPAEGEAEAPVEEKKAEETKKEDKPKEEKK